MNQDEIKITILPDGTIKVETDGIGQANHMSADKLILAVNELAGGKTETTRKGKGHHHGHTHHGHYHEH